MHEAAVWAITRVRLLKSLSQMKTQAVLFLEICLSYSSYLLNFQMKCLPSVHYLFLAFSIEVFCLLCSKVVQQLIQIN